MKLLQIVEPFHRSWSKRDSFPGLHSDSRQCTYVPVTVYCTVYAYCSPSRCDRIHDRITVSPARKPKPPPHDEDRSVNVRLCPSPFFSHKIGVEAASSALRERRIDRKVSRRCLAQQQGAWLCGGKDCPLSTIVLCWANRCSPPIRTRFLLFRG